MTNNSNPTFGASEHFKKRINNRLNIIDCNEEVQDEIIFRIEHHLYGHSVKGKSHNSRKYWLYTNGKLKSMCPSLPDTIKVVYNPITHTLITTMRADD